jgi:chromate transporter
MRPEDEMEIHPGTVAEVFRAFLKLGCSAFGGPVAHLGYFQNEFVIRRKWIEESAYADLVALCQFLPGPTSSQVGLALGWKRAGGWGALAAWAGFTLPSALLMFAFACGVGLAGGIEHAGWVQGLKLAAVAVVAQAVRTMAVKLCPDPIRAIIATCSAILLLLAPWAWIQWFVLVAGACAGAVFLREAAPAGPSAPAFVHRRVNGLPWLAAFGALLLLLPCAARIWPGGLVELGAGFYRAGALVFGGGHVVLPLLEQTTVGRGWMDHDTFLAGYGAAQALPGPLFAVSAYLGTAAGTCGIGGGLVALIAIYLPTVLLLFGTLPHWDKLRTAPRARSIFAGANAAVVGLLGAALYSPIWTSAVTGPDRLAIAIGAYAALEFLRTPPWIVVAACAAIGAIACR